MRNLKVALYQMQAIVGDIENNKQKIITFIKHNPQADILVTPELALCGYSPKDYLYNITFQHLIEQAIDDIVESTNNINATLILGTPRFENGKIYNSAAIIRQGEVIKTIYKYNLPNYGIFNEHRFFSPKRSNNIICVNDSKIAIFVCEDMWHKGIVDNVINDKPDLKLNLIISINASPFEQNKDSSRYAITKYVSSKANAPVVYLNLVGGQDDVVFDGASFIVDAQSNILGHLSYFTEDQTTITLQNKTVIANLKPQEQDTNLLKYNCLVKGTKDFINNCSFKGVIIGMSGGIDSTITATIATDALGKENIIGVAMPSQYTSDLSRQIIKETKKSLGIKIHEVAIDSIVSNYNTTLSNFIQMEKNNVLENIQARVRGQILMAFANNNHDFMVLTTSNKSELAVGYATMYGDTCGGFNLIKDLYKTQVLALCKWRNHNIPSNSKLNKLNVISLDAINRKPSAELRNNQYDEDSLTDYKILDKILYEIIEKNSIKEDIYQKFGEDLVKKVYNLIDGSHYKRLQSALGIKISTRPLSVDFQYPLANKFKITKV